MWFVGRCFGVRVVFGCCCFTPLFSPASLRSFHSPSASLSSCPVLRGLCPLPRRGFHPRHEPPRLLAACPGNGAGERGGVGRGLDPRGRGRGRWARVGPGNKGVCLHPGLGAPLDASWAAWRGPKPRPEGSQAGRVRCPGC